MAFLAKSGLRDYFFQGHYDGGDPGVKEWRYITVDTFATVIAASYIDDTNVIRKLSVGDLIRVYQVTDRNDLSTQVETYELTVTAKTTSTATLEATVGGYEDLPADQLAKLPAPPRINAWDYRWPIFRFAGGSTERAKAESVADFQATFTAAVSTGEKLDLPAWRYPIRTIGLDEGSQQHGVAITSDASIDIECARDATIVVDADTFSGISGGLFRPKASVAPTWSGDLTSFRWKGGRFDARAFTAAHPLESGSGISFIDAFNYFDFSIEDVIFDGGFKAPDGIDPGYGAMDQAVTTHGCAFEKIRGNTFIGMYDQAYYPSGDRVSTTLTDPFTTTNLSADVTVAWTAHGMATGDFVWIRGASAVGGITPAGQYVITKINDDSFTITHGSAATSSATGGGSPTVTDSTKSDSLHYSLAGQRAIVENNWAYRCSSFMAAKRNFLEYSVVNNRIDECVFGIDMSDISEAGAHGKRALVKDNVLTRILFRPIRVLGPGVVVSNNRIHDFARHTDDDGATGSDVGSAVMPAIDILDAPGFKCTENTIWPTKGTLWETEFDTASPTTIGIRILSNVGYIENSDYGLCVNNTIKGCYKGISEDSGCTGNIFRDNAIVDETTASSYEGAVTPRMPINLVAPNTAIPHVTIASGAITVTRNFHIVNTEGGAGTDDLDTITGGAIGDRLLLKTFSSSQDVVVKHAVNNIITKTAADVTLGSANNLIEFVKLTATTWSEV